MTRAVHGGAYWELSDFQKTDSSADWISADVLDAWYPPAPEVTQALLDWSPEFARKSPPTDSHHLVAAISERRGLSPQRVVCGAGSSDLIFRALPLCCSRSGTAVVLDPSYTEYSHVLEGIVGCRVLRVATGFETDSRTIETLIWETVSKHAPQIVVLVRPNNPTGVLVSSEFVLRIADANPKTTFWCDEAYIDFVDPGESVEQRSLERDNVVVCKSMSKVYALSGLRVAYMTGPASIIDSVKQLTPPWCVPLPAQIAGVSALAASDYYTEKVTETARLWNVLASELARMGVAGPIIGAGNFLLFSGPGNGADTGSFVARCRESGLLVRDATSMGESLRSGAVRVAVQEEDRQRRMVSILETVSSAFDWAQGGFSGQGLKSRKLGA